MYTTILLASHTLAAFRIHTVCTWCLDLSLCVHCRQSLFITSFSIQKADCSLLTAFVLLGAFSDHHCLSPGHLLLVVSSSKHKLLQVCAPCVTRSFCCLYCGFQLSISLCSQHIKPGHESVASLAHDEQSLR